MLIDFLKAEKFKQEIFIYSNGVINSAFKAHLAGSDLRIQLYKLWFFNSYLVETRTVEKRQPEALHNLWLLLFLKKCYLMLLIA